jgi:Domain of unknown function (DUF4251)
MRYLSAFLPFLAALTLTTSAQTVKPLIDTQNYVFVAQAVQPMAGSERRLTINSYTLKITKGKITSSLPYFGRENNVPADEVESALAFTSSKFNYTITPTKDDGWKVSIKPKDTRDLSQIKLTISSDGYTVVNASFSGNGLDPIQFTGMIVAPENP